ncbi:MAG: tetratricopeptide repeat protein, partial [Verrucomicrobia bacterium]|nr:tetratricopeptide repeat protein [Verrucomicrobiota bacterium]
AEGNHADAVLAWSALLKDYGSSEYAEETLFRKAMSEIHLKRNEEALPSFYALLKQFPETDFLADAQYWIGMILSKDEKLHDAANVFKAAIDAKPRPELLREAQYQRAVVLHRMKQFDACAELIQPLLDSPVRDRLMPEFLEWLCMYRLERKESDLAMAAARILADLASQPDWQQLGWCLVGRCHKAAGSADEMAKAYTHVLTLKEGNLRAAEAALAIGDYRLEAGDAKSAIVDFGKAASWANTSGSQGIRARAYLGLGRAYKALQQREEAARYFMSVAVLYDDPEVVPECLFRCAEMYAALGQVQNAGKSMDELRQRYPESDWAKRALQESPSP